MDKSLLAQARVWYTDVILIINAMKKKEKVDEIKFSKKDFQNWGAQGLKKAKSKLIKKFGKNYYSKMGKLRWEKLK